MTELWDIYNGCMEKTGRVHERGIPLEKGDYHLVIHVWPVNKKGQLLIQKRADTVKRHPGMWSVTGGSVLSGEDILSGMKRELSEELGLSAGSYEPHLAFILRRHDSFAGVYFCFADVEAEELSLQKEEVAEVKWVTRQQLSDMLDSGSFLLSSDYTEMLFNEIDRIKDFI